MAEPVVLSPELQAEYNQKAGQPAPINPLKDLDAQSLADLEVKDPEGFNIARSFSENPDLHSDPALVQKVADANNLVKQRGFKLEDIPGPKKIAGQVFDVAKGFGKQVWNYASAAAAPIVSAAGDITGQGPEFQKAVGENAQRGVAENIAGSEQAVTGLAGMGARAVNKVFGKSAKDLTPEERVQDLFHDVGQRQQEQEIAKGHGGFMTPVGGEVVKELEQAGKPIRPEETASTAAGDPFSLWAFGKVMQVGGALVPGAIKAGASAVANSAGETATKVIGKGLSNIVAPAVKAGGTAAEKIGKVAEIAAPIIGVVRAIAEGEPSHLLEEGLGGRVAGQTLEAVGKRAKNLSSLAKDFGEQVSGATPVVSPYAQLTRDVAQAAPGALGHLAEGAAIDLGTAAATSERPEETQGVGLGTVLGAAGAAKAVGKHVLSGQLIAPRAYGISTPQAASNNYPILNAMHNAAFAAATPGVQARLNAIRQFARGAAPGTDVFYSDSAKSVEKALIASGVSPEQAQSFSGHEGFFTTELPGKDGQPHRVIVVKNVDAAPHESFHGVQDVLGEGANQKIDDIVRSEYGNRWDTEGENYANRLAGSKREGRDWRETILDETGWGVNAAKEKIAQAIPNANPETVKGLWGQIMDRALQNNPGMSPEQMQQKVWRDMLSPEEATQAADKYLARELAAENFDAVFKHDGTNPPKGLPQRLAAIVGSLVQKLGGNPLAGRKSQIAGIEPRAAVVEAVKGVIPKNPDVSPQAASKQPVPPAQDKVIQKAKDFVSNNPTGLPDRDSAANDILNAAEEGKGIRVLYWGAKGDPAGEMTSVRPERRAEIEAQRGSENKDRELVEKEFFPFKVEMRSNGPQFVGWSPDNFDANTQKLSEWMGQMSRGNKPMPNIPYEFDASTGRFTAKGRKELQADANLFIRNQMSGFTGSGEPLVMPKETAERGFFAPKTEGTPTPLPQDRADVINYLFHAQIPETVSRVAPLHLAGQEVSEATAPGRLVEPVRPRGDYTPEQLAKAGLEGQARGVREVNPFRQSIEQAAKDAGVNRPSLIDVSQRLNIPRIEKSVPSLRQEPFGANTMTLAAGFQPRAEDAEAVNEAAIRSKVNGKVFTGRWHGEAMMKALDSGEAIDDEEIEKEGTKPGEWEDGFTTNGGQFLNRSEAFDRAQSKGQLPASYPKQYPPYGRGEKTSNKLEAVTFQEKRQFQPSASGATADEVADMKPGEFMTWAKGLKGKGFTQVAYEAASAAKPEDIQKFQDNYKRFGEQSDAAIKAGDIQDGMTLASQAQFFREAYEAATNTGSAKGQLAKMRIAAQPKISTENETPKHADEAGLGNYWISPKGEFFYAGDHRRWAKQHVTLDNPQNQVGEHEQALKDAGWVRMSRERETSNPAAFIDGKRLSDKQRTALETWKENNSDVELVDTRSIFYKRGSGLQFQPAVEKVAKDYSDESKIPYVPSKVFSGINPELMKRIADSYASASHDPENKKVTASYEALRSEVKSQYDAIVKAGYSIEPFTGKGEPYKSSADMLSDVEKNKHLFYLPTESGGTLPKDNIMLSDSGVKIDGKPVPLNDIFRAVHDFFGHAKNGYQFGPRGEFNAWRAHSEMFSDEAQPALAAETLSQNAWVNFGPHLRNEAGDIPAKGTPGHVPPPERPFAPQKNTAVPQSIVQEARRVSLQAQPAEQQDEYPLDYDHGFTPRVVQAGEGRNVESVNFGGESSDATNVPELPNARATNVPTHPVPIASNVPTSGKDENKDENNSEKKVDSGTGISHTSTMIQAAPKKESELKFAKPSGGFSKAWILPNGKVVQLGGTLHHEWLENHPDIMQQYGIAKPVNPDWVEQAKVEALKKGFARLNYAQNTGTLTVEARMSDWRRLKPTVEDIATRNIDDIDNMVVHLMDDPVKAVVDSDSSRLFNYDSDREKLHNLPFITKGEPNTVGAKALATEPAATPEAVRKADKYNPSDKYFKAQAQPTVAEPTLFASTDFDDELKSIREGKSGGQTFTTGGHVWKPESNRPEDIVSLASINVPLGEANREHVEAALAKYRDILDEPGIVAGVYAFSKDGKPTVSIDVNALVPKKYRDNTLSFAKDNDQESIWDSAAQETVPVGGKGNTRLRTLGELSDALSMLQRGKPVDVEDIIKQNTSPGETQREQELPGMGKRVLASSVQGNMTKAELASHFPEAVVPASRNELIPSAIKDSPLFKQAGTEDEAVNAFARKLVEFSNEYKSNPIFKSGLKWYSEFEPMLKKRFGKNSQLMAELLAATSPQNDPETNFAYALDALEQHKAGKFDAMIAKFMEGVKMLRDEKKWMPWYDKELQAGKIPNPPVKPTEATFLEHWVHTNNLIPRQTNGKKYGISSGAVLKVLSRVWMKENTGLKTDNFVQNLLGTGHEATIDIWADRTMRRLGYSGFKPRWRILPKNAAPVTDADFVFAQKAFRRAAEQLGIHPDALQGGLWFAEKSLWNHEGWSPLDLGDFRKEIKKTDILKKGFVERARRYATEQASKTPVHQPVDLGITVEPRNVRQ